MEKTSSRVLTTASWCRIVTDRPGACSELLCLGCSSLQGAELPPPGAAPSCAGCLVSASSGALALGRVNVQVRAQQNQGEHLPSVPVILCQVGLVLALGAGVG